MLNTHVVFAKEIGKDDSQLLDFQLMDRHPICGMMLDMKTQVVTDSACPQITVKIVGRYRADHIGSRWS